jgi:hypothetical protein
MMMMVVVVVVMVMVIVVMVMMMMVMMMMVVVVWSAPRVEDAVGEGRLLELVPGLRVRARHLELLLLDRHLHSHVRPPTSAPVSRLSPGVRGAQHRNRQAEPLDPPY